MLLYIVFVFLLLCFGAQGYPPETDPIDWSSISNSTPIERMLQSPFLGECVCDVTWGLCDPNCCCDSDCSADAKALFTFCLPEQFGHPDIDYCYRDNRATRLKRVNNIHDVYIDKRKQAYDAVCIIRANHPGDLYKYFTVPTNVSKPKIPEWEINSSYVPSSKGYKVGTLLPLMKYVDVNGDFVYRNVGIFELPVQSIRGACVLPGRGIGFMTPLDSVSCALNGKQICERFPISHYTNLFLHNPNFPIKNGTAVALTGITVHLINSAGAEIAVINPSDTSIDPAFMSHYDTQFCYNGIERMNATFVYNASLENRIVSADIMLYIKDIPLHSFVPILFQSNFIAQNEIVPTYPISGSPGYVVGESLRAGTLIKVEEKSAILERRGGFALPSGGRLCALGNVRRIPFMNSVLSTGCTVALSEGELLDICNKGSSSLIQDILGSTDMINYVGVTSDALSNDTAAWIPIKGLDSFEDMPGVYDPYMRQCNNIQIGVQYNFVIARAGVEYNPQDVVVGAFAEPITGFWQVRNTTDFSSNAITRQQVRFRVIFSYYNPNSQNTIRRRVIAPPILPRLDDTIFYPFRKPYPL